MDTILFIVGMAVAMSTMYYLVTCIEFFNENFK